MGSRLRVGLAGSGATLLLIFAHYACAQDLGRRRNGAANMNNGSAVAGSTDPATPAVVRTVSGRVTNALTGAPIPRALVTLNGRALLTDPQGKFTFTAFSDPNGYASASKPGYAASATPESIRQQKIPDLDALLELKLYPNAVLSGTITGPDGMPLAHIQVRLRKLYFDTAQTRWTGFGNTQTNARGEYRFEAPAGRYRVVTGYTERSVERGETVLPVIFPSHTSSATEALELANGEERQIDLRPRVAPSYPVQVVVDGAGFDHGLRVTASAATGLVFNLLTVQADGSFTAQLPTGTFLLHATHGDRDEMLEGETRLTVTGRGTAQGALHLSPEPVFPVEIASEFAPPANGSAAPTTASPQQFNLTLQNRASVTDGFQTDPRLTVRPDKSPQFVVPPGRYRLSGGLGGAWYIRSATSGVTDLMTDELVVANGAAGSPIRLVISNATGRVRGSVTTAGQPAVGLVYLIPEQPALNPYYMIYSDGTYRWSGPPGKYIVVASAQVVSEDFHNPVFLRKFTATGREVEITTGTDAALDLELAAPGVAR